MPAYGKIVLMVPEQVSIHIVGRDVHAEMQIPDNFRKFAPLLQILSVSVFLSLSVSVISD